MTCKCPNCGCEFAQERPFPKAGTRLAVAEDVKQSYFAMEKALGLVPDARRYVMEVVMDHGADAITLINLRLEKLVTDVLSEHAPKSSNASGIQTSTDRGFETQIGPIPSSPVPSRAGVEGEMWRLGRANIEGDRGPNFTLPAILCGGIEVCHGTDKDQLRQAKDAHNASLLRAVAAAEKDSSDKGGNS